MGLYQLEKTIIGDKQKALTPGTGKRLTIRRQQCKRCNSVLALEITDKPGFGGDYYVAKDCIWLMGEPHILYDKERWFGNFIRCPVCGIEGRLPMDKPLNWEAMQHSREVTNAIQG